MNKRLTNEQKLIKLIKKNETLLNALLVERIGLMMELTEQEIKERHKKGERFSLFVPDQYYIQLSANVREILSTKEEYI